MANKANTLPDSPPREGTQRRARYDEAHERAFRTNTDPQEWFGSTRLLDLREMRTPQAAWQELGQHNRVAPASLDHEGSPARMASADWLSEYSTLTARKRGDDDWSLPLGILRRDNGQAMPTVLISANATAGSDAVEHLQRELTGRSDDLYLTLTPVPMPNANGSQQQQQQQ